MKSFEQDNDNDSLIVIISIISIIISFMIRTVILRIIFTLSLFAILLLLSLYVFSMETKEGKVNVTITANAKTSLALYCLGILSSFAVLYLPAAKYQVNPIWTIFTSLDASDFIRVASGFFIALIFPGYVAYRALIGAE